MRPPRRRGLAALIAVGLALPGPAPAEPTAGALRWRLTVEGAKAHLFAAAFDATDADGGISLRCTLGQDVIEAAIRVDADTQKAFARILADDLYPQVRFKSRSGETRLNLIERITYGEIGGWEFHFSMVADASPMDAFEKTGSFHVAVGTVYATGIDLKAGLDAITAFRRHCRKDAAGLRR